MADAIILDGHLKSALAAARSLARGGITVRCGAVRASAPTLHSRACTTSFRYPDPLIDLDGFIAAVNRHVSPGSVIFPFSDRTALALSRHRDRLAPDIRLLMPSAEIVETVFNKERFSALAAELCVPVPETMPAPDNFPVVIKPRFNCFWNGNTGVSVSTTIAHNKNETLAAINELQMRTGEAPLLQRWVAGGEYGVTVLCRAGEILAMSAHRRLRSLALSGGASTAKETIKIPDSFRGPIERIVHRLSWTGPAMFEFRGDPQGTFVLLEMNGRFWGSLPLAVMAGTDFPLLAFQMATNQELTGHRAGRVGMYSRHFMGDIARITRVSGVARLSAIGAFFRGLFLPFHDDLCSWRDPFPWFWDIVDSIKR